ncbi:unnamed protein product [Notodromas monacha]|uniref:Alpha-mannosidase n=1 Tax=Notodromas monacha TaxID=399045 RepID=A0A7R9BMX6_9CRUS|nr:unnamed protein product [Notodromas monacha]CAG0918464.1 unnamed protein product [Notodromas monacha]
MIKLFRRRAARWLLIVCFVGIPIFIIFNSLDFGGNTSTKLLHSSLKTRFTDSKHRNLNKVFAPPDTCPRIGEASADINTLEVFKNFNFQPPWASLRSFWDQKFEERYLLRKTKHKNLPLKVFLMFWSHNDPGWLKTAEEYYTLQTGPILRNMVKKLTEFKRLTFTWTEMSYLSMYWDRATSDEKRVLKELIDENRLEITTGGWVMTDEASVHLYAMIDQLIEGHQWLRHHLGVAPESGWSVDPFGHGATVPYLLRASGLEQMIIQRIHFAWKEWLAAQQAGDFLWRQGWDASSEADILCHNMPYDIYSIKHTCGPHHEICLAFDFRKIHGELTEFSVRATEIDANNIRDKATTLVEEYRRTASLFPHNVVLVPVGDDFRFDHSQEWDQQFKNYEKLVDYVNGNKDIYNADIKFGTVKDYFKAVREWTKDFPTLQGDFFVYSDVFSDGEPAYWSGYFTTRPFWKSFTRETEAVLRNAEILYTFAYQKARQANNKRYEDLLKLTYKDMVISRRNLAAFQHHDAITGTSKIRVTQDFGLKLYESFTRARKIQALAVQSLIDAKSESDNGPLVSKYSLDDGIFVLHARDRAKYDQLTQQVPIYVQTDGRKIVIFNSHAHRRVEPVYVLVKHSDVVVTDSDGNPVRIQVNPVWNMTKGSPNLLVSSTQYELILLADLAPLSLTTYYLKRNADQSPVSLKTSVYCNFVGNRDAVVDNFKVQIVPDGDVQLENPRFRLLFSGNTKLLKRVFDKRSGKERKVQLQFGQYATAPYQSGAYLMKILRKPVHPDLGSIPKKKVEQPVDSLGRFVPGEEGLPFIDPNAVPRVIITSGLLESEITVIFDRHLLYSMRVYHAVESPTVDAIKFTTLVNLADKPDPHSESQRFNFNGIDAFVRFVTDVDNGEKPVFYSDANGYQMMKREKIDAIKVEGNYYPATTAAFIQDPSMRFTVLTSHSRGVTSLRPGELELALDRRSKSDDSRGMGEGVTDNVLTRADGWLLLEERSGGGGDAGGGGGAGKYSDVALSFPAQHLSDGLLYAPAVYVLDTAEDVRPKANEMDFLPLLQVELLQRSEPLSCDVHLLTLRTTADVRGNFSEPGKEALMVVQRKGFSCSYGTLSGVPCAVVETAAVYSNADLGEAQVDHVEETTLTGMESRGKLSGISALKLGPMELKSLKISFV